MYGFLEKISHKSWLKIKILLKQREESRKAVRGAAITSKTVKTWR
jgi:hypothetical protein